MNSQYLGRIYSIDLWEVAKDLGRFINSVYFLLWVKNCVLQAYIAFMCFLQVMTVSIIVHGVYLTEMFKILWHFGDQCQCQGLMQAVELPFHAGREN